MEDIKPIVRRPQPAVAPKINTTAKFSQSVIRPPREGNIPRDFEPDAHRPRYMLWGVAIVSVFVLFVALSYAFGGATVTVTPKTQKQTIDGTFQASKDSEADGVISFDLMTLTDEKSKDIASSGVKQVEEKATGKVLLSNSFGTAPQHLKEETRLLATSGKIYKIVGAVDIPGEKTVGGKLVPGTISVVVFAEKAGEEYNTTGPTDFKIFGFKGNPKYDKFAGHADDPITGGNIGTEPGVQDADLKVAEESLKNDVDSSLLQKAKAQLPPGYILYDDAVFKKFDPIALVAGSTDKSTATIKATMYGLIFNQKKLTAAIAKKVIRDYDGNEFTSDDIKNLTFALQNKDALSPADATDISFSLTGDAKFVSVIPSEKIAKELAGISKSEFETIMQKYPGVVSASMSLKPFWKGTFPSNANDIQIVVNNPTENTP